MRTLLPATLGAALVLSGCVPIPTRTESAVPEASMHLSHDETFVLLAGRSDPRVSKATPTDWVRIFDFEAPDRLVPELVRCMSSSLRESSPSLGSHLLDTDSFADALFPWFEVDTAPASMTELRAVLERPPVRQRVGDLRLRYMVHVSAAWKAEGLPWLTCGAAPGVGAGVGCLGIGWERSEVALVTRIWDLANLTETESTSMTQGRSFGFALGLPLVFKADAARGACRAAAAQLERTMDVR